MPNVIHSRDFCSFMVATVMKKSWNFKVVYHRYVMMLKNYLREEGLFNVKSNILSMEHFDVDCCYMLKRKCQQGEPGGSCIAIRIPSLIKLVIVISILYKI